MVDEKLLTYLSEFITKKRFELFKSVLAERTQYFTIVLEDIYHAQNASAVLRTCDCFGIQDVHIIENKHEYDVNPDVALGANQWLSLTKYNNEADNTSKAISELKKKGYRIIATSPHAKGDSLNTFDIHAGKAAFVFGSELCGVSDDIKSQADGFLKIPMYGFTESFNISVSAAICLHDLIERLKHSDIAWSLDEPTYNNVLFGWLMHSIKSSELILKRYQSMG